MERIGAIHDFINYAQPYEYVSFDLFDTLIKRRFLGVGEVHDTVSAYAQALVGRRHERSPSEVTSLRYAVGTALKGTADAAIQEPTVAMVWQSILGHAHMIVPGVDREALTERVVAFEHAIEKANLVAVAGARELLKSLRAQRKTIIAISDMYFTHEQMREILEDVGLLDLFDHIYVSAHSNLTKQTGDLFRAVLDDLAIPPHAMLHVGDNLQSDIVMAGQVGVPAILVEQHQLLQLERPDYGKRDRVEEEIADIVKAHLCSVLMDAFHRKSDHLYFMARDGCAIHRFMTAWSSGILKEFLPAPPSSDLYLNRVLTAWANVDFSSSDWLVAAVGIAFWLKQGSATAEQLSSLLGIDAVPTELGSNVLNSANDTFRVVQAYRDQDLESVIRGAIAKKRLAVARYLEDIGFFDHRAVTMSDVGYSGTVLRSLNTLLLQQIAEGKRLSPPAMSLHLMVTYANYEVNRVPALPFVIFSPHVVLPVDQLPPGLRESFAWIELFFKHPTLRPILNFVERDGKLEPDLSEDAPPSEPTPGERLEGFAIDRKEDIVLLWMAATGRFETLAGPILERFDKPDADTIAQMRDDLYELDPIEGTKRSIILEIPNVQSEIVSEAARKGDYWISGSVAASLLASDDPDAIDDADRRKGPLHVPFPRARPGLIAGIMRKLRRPAAPVPRALRGFDAAFYGSFYLDLRHMDEDELRLHYWRHGRREKRLASGLALKLQLETEIGAIPNDFETGSYLHYNPDLAGLLDTPERALDHFMRSGRREGRSYQPALAELNRAFDKFRVSGEILLTPAELRRHQQGETVLKIFLDRYDLKIGPWIDSIEVAEFRALHFAWCGPVKSLADCVIVICDRGLPRAPSLSLAATFDDAFYRQHRPELATFSAEQLYRHYLITGIAEGLAPSEEAGLHRLWRRSEFPALDWESYRRSHDKTRRLGDRRIDILKAFIDAPGLDRKRYVRGSGAAAFLEFLGLRAWHHHRRIDEARGFLSAALAAGGRAGWIEHLLGDLENEMGHPQKALEHYRRGMADRSPNRWSYVNAARLLLDSDDYKSALRFLIESRTIWQEVEPWRTYYARALHLWSQACRRRLSSSTDKGWGLAEADEIVREIRTRQPKAVDLRAVDASLLVISGRTISEARRDQFMLPGVVLHGLNAIDAHDYLPSILQAGRVIFHEVPFTYEVLLAVETARSLGREVIFWFGDLKPWQGHALDLLIWTATGQEATAQRAPQMSEMALVARYCDRAITTLAGGRPAFEALAPETSLEICVEPQVDLRGAHEALKIVLVQPAMAADAAALAPLASVLRDAAASDRRLHFMIDAKLASRRELQDLAGRFDLIDASVDLASLSRMIGTADLVIETIAESETLYSLAIEAEALGVPSIRLPVSRDETKNRVTKECTSDDMSGAAAAIVAGLSGDKPKADRKSGASGFLAEQANRPARPQKPRILLVNVWFAPQVIGGSARVARDNVDYFIDKHSDDFEIAIFCSDEHNESLGQFTVDTYRGVPIFRVATPSEPNIYWRGVTSMVGARFDAVIGAFEPDIVHIHCLQRLSVTVAEACAARQIPYLITLHDAWWLSDYFFLSDEHGLETPARHDFVEQDRPAGIGADRSVQRSQRLRSALLGATKRLAVSASFATIYEACGIPCDVIENGTSRSKVLPRQRASKRVELCHVGGLEHHKGAFLVEAALRNNRYANLAYTVVDLSRGEGHAEELVWGDTPVTIIGRMGSEAMALFYARMNVLLAPSTCQESYGLVAREALDHGLWVVASDRGAIGEAVTPNHDGFVVSVEDAAGVAAALAKIDADPDRFREPPFYQREARVADDQSADLIDLYRTLLDGHAVTAEG